MRRVSSSSAVRKGVHTAVGLTSAASIGRSFGLYGTPAPAPAPDPSLRLGATGTVKAPPSPFFKPESLMRAQGIEPDAEGPAALEGTIVVWSSVDRKGIIEVKGGVGLPNKKTRWYRILSPRAFETLVPPHVKDLTGARVTHFVPVEATDGSHEPVRVYNKLVRPVFRQPSPMVPHKDLLAKAERQMQRRAHTIDVAAAVDRLEAIAFDKGVVADKAAASSAESATGASSSSSSTAEAEAMMREMKAIGAKANEAVMRRARGEEGIGAGGDLLRLEEEDALAAEEAAEEESLRFDEYGRPMTSDRLDIATKIIVDLSTAVSAKGADLAELKSRDYFSGGVRPALNSGVKDIRNKTLFTKEELALVAARREVSARRREAIERGEPAESVGPVTPSATDAEVTALAAVRLRELQEEEAGVAAHRAATNDMSTLGVKKIDRNTVKFSFGSGAAASSSSATNASADPSGNANAAAAASNADESDGRTALQREKDFGEVLKAMRSRMTASTSASAAAAAAAIGSSANTVIRTVYATKVTGRVIAWSQLHRTGLVVRYDATKSEEENKAVEEALDSSLKDGFVIRNVDAFSSAMPTAAALSGRTVEFTVVTYSDVKGGATRFAEDIVILGGPINFNLHNPEALKAAKEKEKEEQRLRRAHKNYIQEEVKRPTEAPKGHLFGVITRWSGGQGAVEASSGVVYYINNPSVFTTVVDSTHAAGIRGAVVRFAVDPSNVEYVSSVELLSTAAAGAGGQGITFGGGAKTVGDMSGAAHGSPDVRTVMAEELGIGGADGASSSSAEYDVLKPTPATLAARRKLTAAAAADKTLITNINATKQRAAEDKAAEASILVDGVDPRRNVMHSGDIAPDDPRWRFGFLVTYSEVEGQAIIQSLSKKFESLEVADERGIRRLRPHQLGDRYLLKEFNTNVVNYDGANRVMIRKGRKVKFIPFGTSGRMATLVTPTDLALTEEELAALEAADAAKDEEAGRELAASEEALPGPTSGTYWMERLEGAGFDMSEMRELKGNGADGALDPREHAKKRANVLGLDEEDLQDGAFDPIALVESDPWFKDKSKNIKIPGSDMRLGDMQKLSPASMLGMATKVKDPATLQKTKDKYYSRLTEPQKEWAWNQAKEQAPLFEKRIKQAQMRGEEPKFNYF